MRHEHFKIYAVDKWARNIDLGNCNSLVDAGNDSMSRASMNVWLFVLIIIMTGIEI